MRPALVIAVAAAARAAAGEERTEVGVLPGFTYSSDTGLGLGAVGSLARVAPDVAPYRWRLQVQLFASAKTSPEGGLELVTHDDYVDLDVPGLAGGLLRLRGRLGFARGTTTGWYGVGNAAPEDPALVAANPRYYSYDRVQGRAEAGARVRVAPRLELSADVRATVTGIDTYPGSRLEEDRATLVAVEDHGDIVVAAGAVVDTRDHEPAPATGVVAELAVRAGAGLGVAFGYFGVTAAVRGFVPLAGDRLVAAARLAGDVLAGNPPFDELARIGGLSGGDATGGGTSLRGVPAQRYHGRAKLLGNAELRARIVPFDIGSQHFRLGALAFVDAGRVFHDPDVDGDALGLHLGIGGGLRLEWGTTFVIRVDAAWSPEGTSGYYIDVGHIF